MAILRYVLLSLLALWAVAPSAARAEPLPPAERRDLQRILQDGLRTFQADQRLFIHRVLDVVDQPNSPLSSGLVKAVFQRARARRPKFPFPDFQRMMIEIARSRGVRL